MESPAYPPSTSSGAGTRGAGSWPAGLSGDEALRETLEVLADDVLAHAGFGAVVVSLRSTETDLEVIASRGDERVRRHLLGSRVPLVVLDGLLRAGQSWGNLHFIPDASVPTAGLHESSWWWEDQGEERVASPGARTEWWTEEAWTPRNALLAPLLRDDGEVLGLVSVDLPTNGRRPNEAQRVALSMHVRQAERTVIAAMRRVAELHHLKLAQAARAVVREAGLQHHLAQLLPRARTAMLTHFDVCRVWIKSSSPSDGLGGQASSSAGAPAQVMAPAAGSAEALPPTLLSSLTLAADECWRRQVAVEVSRGGPVVPGMVRSEVDDLLAFLESHDVRSALIVPLGSSDTRLGSMILGRVHASRGWSAAEKEVALDISHDLGRAIVHTLWFEAQVQMTEEVKAHAEYRRELLMTMSHELQTPLASVQANIELISHSNDDPELVAQSLDAIGRGSDRLTKLINNMLWLARVDDPHRPVSTEPVDLAETARIVVEDATLHNPAVAAGDDDRSLRRREGGRELVLTLPAKPLWVCGTASELVLACCNLVANAIKYTDDGGHVHVEVSEHLGRARVRVTDDGIGIAPSEVSAIFDEFYRSPSPAVRKRPGSGLGLSIVNRVVTRHEGTISVAENRPGRTSFELDLPLAPPAARSA